MSEQKVEAVERALSILEAFADGSRHLSLAELARRTGLYRSTILRLSASLERFGYIFRRQDGDFRLGSSLWRLGVLYQNAFDLAEYVRPVLQELVDETTETAAFYIREGDRRICLYRHHSPRLIRHHVEEGAELPLDRGASGRVLIAFTEDKGELDDQVQVNGYCVSLGERDPEIAAVSASVFGPEGRFIGALGVTGARARFEEGNCESILAAVQRHARRLSKALGGN